jgi:hypothetical protein
MTAVPESGCDLDRRGLRSEIVMEAARRGRRGKWRHGKSRRKLPRAAKGSERWRRDRSQAHHSINGESADKLLLSALNYWEAKRDLIEERLAAIRSATATS